jgi:hypothetical protein
MTALLLIISYIVFKEPETALPTLPSMWCHKAAASKFYWRKHRRRLYYIIIGVTLKEPMTSLLQIIIDFVFKEAEMTEPKSHSRWRLHYLIEASRDGGFARGRDCI